MKERVETTPDGRYLIVRGRLWRSSNPNLPPVERQQWVDRLMSARREVGAALKAGDAEYLAAARAKVQTAKLGLGERGPVWWSDGAKDYTRHLIKNTPYAVSNPENKMGAPHEAKRPPKRPSR